MINHDYGEEEMVWMRLKLPKMGFFSNLAQLKPNSHCNLSWSSHVTTWVKNPDNVHVATWVNYSSNVMTCGCPRLDVQVPKSRRGASDPRNVATCILDVATCVLDVATCVLDVATCDLDIAT